MEIDKEMMEVMIDALDVILHEIQFLKPNERIGRALGLEMPPLPGLPENCLLVIQPMAIKEEKVPLGFTVH